MPDSCRRSGLVLGLGSGGQDQSWHSQLFQHASGDEDEELRAEQGSCQDGQQWGCVEVADGFLKAAAARPG